jgi:hypothetical protein
MTRLVLHLLHLAAIIQCKVDECYRAGAGFILGYFAASAFLDTGC